MRWNAIVWLVAVVVVAAGFGVTIPRPTAQHPGAISLRTGMPYNQEEGFALSRYTGFGEDKLVQGAYPGDKFVVSERARQRHVFDSLGVGKKAELIPGLVHLTGNLYMDEAEVSNLDYKEFLFYLKRDSDAVYEQQASLKLQVLDHAASNYFNDPRYRFFPVVGLTREQAEDYCKWRGRMVTVMRQEKGNRHQFIYRLPTEAEWELGASNGLDRKRYAYGVERIQKVPLKVNAKATEFVSEMIKPELEEDKIWYDITWQGQIQDLPFHVKRELPYFLQFNTPYYVYSFYRNDLGLYNMIGNAAEMVAEPGVVKGGSFRDELPAVTITSRRAFSGPGDDIGFRCVCEIK